MNAVGIDVSKGKSTVAIMRPYGEIVALPFEINHTEDDFKKLVSQIQKLQGESRIIMEYTGRYYEPLANYLYNAGLHVSVVNAILIHDYSNSSIRRVMRQLPVCPIMQTLNLLLLRLQMNSFR